jgi:hypothetical protein
MMRKLLAPLLAVLYWALAGLPAMGQQQVGLMCLNPNYSSSTPGSPRFLACGATAAGVSTPLVVSATVSASVTSLAPSGAASLAVTSSTGRVALPNAEASALVCNAGSVTVYYKLGTVAVTAATTDYPLLAGYCNGISVGVNTHIAAITSSGTSTLVLTQGTGLPVISGGGSGGGAGGAVTIADGADVAQGTTTDAACATDNGTCTELALIKRTNQRLTTLNTTLGTPLQAGGNIGTVTAVTSITNAVTVAQATAASLNATVVGTGTFAVQAAATLAAETTKVIGTVRMLGNAGAIFDGATGAAVPANVLYHGINVGGNLRGVTGLSLGTTFSQTVAIVDGSGNQVTSFGGSGGTASNFGSAVPATGTAMGASDGTNMQNPRVFDGDSGAGTEYTLGVIPRIPASGGSIPLVGGSGVDAAGALRVSLATNVALPAGTAILGKVGIDQTTPGTTNLVALTAETTKIIGVVQGAVASAAADSGNPLKVGGKYNASPITLTDGNRGDAQLDVNGYLKVNVATATGLAQGSTTSGQTGSLVMGAVTTAAPSYTTAQTSPLSLDTSGNLRVSTGTVTVTATNLSTNIAQMNGVTVLMGNGASGTGAQRVSISNDSTAIAGWGHVATGAAPPTGSTYISANASGATGGLVAGLIQCDSKAIYDASTSGSTELVALTSGRTIYVCGYSILAGGTVNVKLIYGTGTACATGSNNMTPAWQLTAQTGLVDGSPFSRGLKTASANALCINTSAGVATQAIVYYSII